MAYQSTYKCPRVNLESQGQWPLRITANAAIAASAFMAANNHELQSAMSTAGCILLRGFRVDNLEEFRFAVSKLCSSLINEYGDLPSSGVQGAYNATPYDNRLDIHFHNEASHTAIAPSRQFFLCEKAAAEGGQWRVADGRRVVARLTDCLVERFLAKRLRYSRRFVPNVDVSWQHFLKTSDRDQAVLNAIELGFEVEWERRTGFLNLSRVAPAIVYGGTVWFNQILLHHRLALPERTRAVLLRTFGDAPFPREVYFGDGSPIDSQTLTEVRRALEAEAVDIENRSGDILLVNNILVAHSRAPYQGERRVRVVLGDPVHVESVT